MGDENKQKVRSIALEEVGVCVCERENKGEGELVNVSHSVSYSFSSPTTHLPYVPVLLPPI